MFQQRLNDGNIDILRFLQSIFEDILVNFEINGTQPILDWHMQNCIKLK